MRNVGLQFKTILVATDLGHLASSALRYAQALARHHGSTLVVAHVIDPIAYAFPQGEPAFHSAGDAAREELRRIEEETRLLGIPIHSIMETGVVCERILQAMKDHNADLLVLGTRGRTEAGRVALGTVARQLLAKATAPVMTVSPNAEASLPSTGGWRRVLAATDFSPVSIAAVQRAHGLATERLVILHVPSCHRENECLHCLDRLRLVIPHDESNTVPVETIVTSGQAAETIVEYANKHDVDVVVLGAPENELAEEDFQASTVLQVISNVACPVLCVPVGHNESPEELIREVSFVS